MNTGEINSNGLLYLILIINILLLILNVFFFLRLKLIKYLLEQPVVKKVSSTTKLKPYKVNRGKPKDKTNSRSKSYKGKEGRDSRQDKNSRTDRNRGNGRYQRGRGSKSDQPSRNASIPGNQAAEQQEKKIEEASKPQTNAVAEEPKAVLAPEPTKPQENNSEINVQPPNQDNSAKLEPLASSEDIQHGRRVKVKKAPTFEE